MDKSRFTADTRYSVTLREADGKLRAASIYVHRLFDDYMIARRIDGAQLGMLFKIPYQDIVRIVRVIPVADEQRFMVPDAMLNPKVWETRDTMMAYGSSPGLGK
ncbi:hypothetical protein B1C78_14975 [Thioalkalivibrio denitrificans]|uniref:Uncharacterized protein n=1 Tax=Thioalkalivibrio denitrificans TaxID=108003 RepID=A0A1V3NC24_9GAMM|nr:hypothetical protein [Thioalkalivibrio denitrificans]OOG22493.1 hypothetical protein B1C78_14975 [Thioalkalivibrio denitrificans]